MSNLSRCVGMSLWDITEFWTERAYHSYIYMYVETFVCSMLPMNNVAV